MDDAITLLRELQQIGLSTSEMVLCVIVFFQQRRIQELADTVIKLALRDNR